MAKTDKKSKDNLSPALASLREELRQDTLGLSKSIEQLKASNASNNDPRRYRESLQALRQELRHEVNSLSQQIEQGQLEQAQSMLVTPETDTAEFTNAVTSLREELHKNVLGLTESFEQLKAATASNERQLDSDAIANSIEALRSELRGEATRLSQRIEQAQLEQSERGSVAAEADMSEFSNTVQSLRGELKRDVQNLSQTIARNEPRSSGAPVLTTVALLASLATGAFAMAFYQRWTEDNSPSQEYVELSAKIASIDKLDRLEILAEAQVTESTSQQQAIERMNETIFGLQDALQAQDERFEQGISPITESLASEVSKIAAKDVTVVAKPPIGGPRNDETPEDPAKTDDEPEAEATAQAEVEAGSPAGEDDPVAVDPAAEEPLERVENVVRSPTQAKLIIDNPTRFQFKLKINGEEVEVAARDVTTVPLTQGVIKTEIGSYSQEWDDWKVVDGEPRLKITVESGADYYKLR